KLHGHNTSCIHINCHFIFDPLLCYDLYFINQYSLFMFQLYFYYLSGYLFKCNTDRLFNRNSAIPSRYMMLVLGMPAIVVLHMLPTWFPILLCMQWIPVMTIHKPFSFLHLIVCFTYYVNTYEMCPFYRHRAEYTSWIFTFFTF